MNYQIQGLSIRAEVHGTAEPALVFLNYWGSTPETGGDQRIVGKQAWLRLGPTLRRTSALVTEWSQNWGHSAKLSC